MKMSHRQRIVVRWLTVIFAGGLLAVSLPFITNQHQTSPLPTLAVLPSLANTEQASVSISDANPTTDPTAHSTDVEMVSEIITSNGSQSSLNNSAYSSSLSIVIPESAVPNQLVLQFREDASDEQIAGYLQTIRGSIVQRIDALHTLVVSVPPEVAAVPIPSSSILTQAEPDYFAAAVGIVAPTNDERFSEQWALQKINLPEAWEALPSTLSPILIGVIDSGICANHPDLKNRVLNGKVFLNDNTSIQDELGHGCAVSGIIAADIDNGIGIAGVVPNAQIFPLKVLNQEGVGTYSSIAAAIVYAADNGVQIINLSLGGINPSSLLENAVRYAHNKGIVLVAAAGNTGDQKVLYPAAYSEVIAVGSVGEQLHPSAFSSRGEKIGLWAPGENILTTALDNSYQLMSGTSFAAPFVTGVAALELAQGRRLIANGGVLSAVSNSSGNLPTPTPTTEEKTTKFATEVLQELEQTGQAHVIINLFKPVSAQSASEESQLAAIQSVQNSVLAQLNQNDFTLTQQYPTLPGLVGIIEPSALQILEANTSVESITPNSLTYAQMTESIPALGADRVHNELGFTGEGVVVAVLDTGVAINHPALRDSIIAQYCITEQSCQPGNTDTGPNADDDNGHGTNVAGIITANAGFAPGIVGFAPDADIVAVKVLGDDGIGRADTWTAGLQWVVNEIKAKRLKVDVVNLSIGTEPILSNSNTACDILYPLAAQAVRELNNLGVVVFASSGNNGSTLGISAPACLTGVIAVGATYDSNLGREPDSGTYSNPLDNPSDPNFADCADETTSLQTIACFTNRNALLDILAPGAVITSTGYTGELSEYSGTSQSAPVAAGVAALMFQANPNLVPSQIESLLKTETDIFIASDGGLTYPLIKAFQAVEAARDLTFSCSVGTRLPQSECQALVTLYGQLQGGQWINRAGWLLDNNPCDWFGVQCLGEAAPDFDTRDDLTHVTGLDLRSNHLTGAIPSVIDDFPALVDLYLQNNVLSGEVPVEITHLKGLARLDISYNLLTSTNDDVKKLLNSFNLGWEKTQTITPQNVAAFASSLTSFGVVWSRIDYVQDEGHYNITCTSPNVPPLEAQTADKIENTHTFNDAVPNTTYNCTVSAFTKAHGLQPSDLLSLPSMPASVTTSTANLGLQEQRIPVAEDIFLSPCVPSNGDFDRFALFIGYYTDFAPPPPIDNYCNSRTLMRFAAGGLPEFALPENLELRVWHYGTNQNHKNVHVSLLTSEAWNEATKYPNPIYNAFEGDYGQLLFEYENNGIPRERIISLNSVLLDNLSALSANGIMLRYGSVAEESDISTGVVICPNAPLGNVCNAATRPYISIHFRTNAQPGRGINPTPDIGAKDQDSTLTLTWDAMPEPNGDAVTYEIYTGTSPDSLTLVASGLTERSYPLTIITYGQQFWRVDVRDEHGALTTGDIWNFFPKVCGGVTEIPSSECEAVRQLYLSTNGDQWLDKAGWLEDITPCDWYGVVCAEGHIVELNLPGNLLAGTLPYEIGNLLELQALRLNNNQLSGGLPDSLGNLTKLEILDLNSNVLSSPLASSLGELINLQILNLQNNQLTGSIPEALGNLAALKQLYLGQNRFSGAIPPSFGDLVNLQELILRENQLSGSIPATFGDLENLTLLDLSYNQLSGNVPTSIMNLRGMIDLYTYNLSNREISRYNGITGLFKEIFVPSTVNNLCCSGDFTFGPDNNLYIADVQTEAGSDDQILRYDGVTGTFIDVFVKAGLGELNAAGNLIFGSDGNLYVVSGRTDRVIRYNGISGELIDIFIPAGRGGLIQPGAMVFGLDGNLYVASAASGAQAEILRYSSTGTFLDRFVPEEDNGSLNGAFHMVFGPDGDLYVTSYYTSEVLRYDGITGEFVEAFVQANAGGLVQPTDLAFGMDGNLYVSGSGGHIRRYNGQTGDFIDIFTEVVGGQNALEFHSRVDIGYNKLSASNTSLRNFLNVLDQDWEQTQTLPPTNLVVIDETINTASLSWSLPRFTTGIGNYAVLCSDTTGGPYARAVETSDKLTRSVVLTQLIEGTTYFCVAQTYTSATAPQKNELRSDYSDEISFTTEGDPRGLTPCDPIDVGTLPFNNSQKIEPGEPHTAPPATDCEMTADTGKSWLRINGNGHIVRLSTRGSDFDTVMYVYRGEPGNLTLIDQNDDLPPTQAHSLDQPAAMAINPEDFTSRIDLPTEIGVTYFVAVVDKHGTGGTLTFSAVALTFASCAEVTGISVSECNALQSLYNQTDGPNWGQDSNWFITNTPCEDWAGLECFGGHVVSLDLSNRNLKGSLPVEIGDLVYLQRLVLAHNQLQGEIPAEIRNLAALVEADFGFNMFMASDPATEAFLNGIDWNWADTQTVPPSRLNAIPLSSTDIQLFWEPIRFSSGDGHYEISYATNPDGPYVVHGVTANKFASSYIVDGLDPSTTYYFIVRTFTADSALLSVASHVVQATTFYPPTLTVQVTAPQDDVNEDGGLYEVSNPLIWIGNGTDDSPDFAGLRFCNVNIPRGATILDAHLEFYNPEYSWIRMGVLIAAEASDNSPTFAPDNRPWQRVMTTARDMQVSDDLWLANQWYPVGKLNDVVGEVINRAGWQAGNCLSIVLRGAGDTWGRKYLVAYETDPTFAPKLVISFSAIQPTPTLILPTQTPTPTPETQGAGLWAEYFDDMEFNQPVFARVDTVVNFDWGTESPDENLGTDAFSVRWTGQIQPRYTEEYTFWVRNDDGVRLWVDDQLIIDTWLIPNAPAEVSGTIFLTSEKDYNIRLEYREYAGNAYISLSWSSFTQIKQIIPPTQLSNPLSDLTATEYVIVADQDDVNEDNQTFDIDKMAIWIGDSNQNGLLGLRFQQIDLAQGTAIADAYLEFYNPEDSWINVDTLISADASANSAPFTITNRPSMRLLTEQNTINRSNVLWSRDTWYTMGNLAPIVQEVLNTPEWNSSNSLSLILQGVGRQWGRKYLASYHIDPQLAPRLIVVYGVSQIQMQQYVETPTPFIAEPMTPTPTIMTTEAPIQVSTLTETPIPTETLTETPMPTLIETPTLTETSTLLPTLTETPIPTETLTETPMPTLIETPTLTETSILTEMPIFTETPILSGEIANPPSSGSN